MTSFAKTSTLDLPLLRDLNRETPERNVLLMLRTLYTSDLAWTYMLLETSTVRDICDMCTKTLDRPSIGYPDQGVAPWALDMTPAEYTEAREYIAAMLADADRTDEMKKSIK